MTGFKEMTVKAPYTGDKKILVLGTSKFLLPCMNGTYFNTGHHTTETFVPMYHFDKAGFKFDIATEDGSPVALEEWTFPMAVGYESNLREIHSKVKDQLEKPKKYEDIPEDLEGYAAIFIPGGHGPIIDMHNHESLGMFFAQLMRRESLQSASVTGLPLFGLLRSVAISHTKDTK